MTAILAQAPRTLHPRRTLPVVEHHGVHLDADERLRLERLAARLLADEPALAITALPAVCGAGDPDGPTLFIEDRSDIALMSVQRQDVYAYRSLLLAGDRDQVLVQRLREPAFETYCGEDLGLGTPSVLQVRPLAGQGSLAAATLSDARILRQLAAHARRLGSLTVVPYMGTARVWMLARALAELAAVPVHVAAPPPRLTARANDKLWFSRRLVEVLGRGALPITYASFGPTGVAQRLAALARRNPVVVLKVPDSAGSLGNVVIRSADLLRRSTVSIAERLDALLRTVGWSGSYPLLVGVWDAPILDSPSVQLWVPDPVDGPPVVEGVFSQVVAGVAGTFVGAAPCELSPAWQRRLADEALRLAYLLQRLGFYGRCSFDAVVTGEDSDAAQLHWVECNARWGGVSIPMTLANRLVDDWRARWFAVVQEGKVGAGSVRFDAALELLGDRLLTRENPAGRIVLLSPGHADEESGPHFMVLAQDAADAAQEIIAATALLSR
jgi:hypothetical protein